MAFFQNISYNSRKTMHKKGASSVSKPIVVDLDGRPVSQSDDEEFMMMSDAILAENEGQKSPSRARSQIRITDDLRGHTVAPRRARSTFIDGEMRKHSRLEVKTARPRPATVPTTSSQPAAALAPPKKKSGVTSPVLTAKPSPATVPTTSPEPAAAPAPSKKKKGVTSPVLTAKPSPATVPTTSPDAVVDNAKKMDKTPNDAKKYSFLNKEGNSVYEQKVDLGELSDFDLYVGL
ncbi:hypothetical protein ANCDUO_09634 [Ancylostoma duodenale]|uniref:Uncharacterized protein n=1 Tax=Ancylostoma duodenale TaxID=51022 RepID=A0A0C2GSP2_9BILA|nr:hypothetical protein ANCDUO_09634 [Ancylostoma duodenale]